MIRNMDLPILLTRFNQNTKDKFLSQVPGRHENEGDAAVRFWLNSPRRISKKTLAMFGASLDDGHVCVILMLNGTPSDLVRNDNKTNRIWGIVIIDLRGVRIGPAANRRVYSEDRRNIYGYPVREFISLDHLYEVNLGEEWVLPLEQRVLLNAINALLFTGKEHQKRGYGITSAKCVHNETYFKRFVNWAITASRNAC